MSNNSLPPDVLAAASRRQGPQVKLGVNITTSSAVAAKIGQSTQNIARTHNSTLGVGV